MYICSKSITLGGAKYDKGDTEFDSSPCHILHPHTRFEGCKIWCYTGRTGSVTVQSVTLAGLSVSVPDRPVKFQGRSVTLTDWVLESRKFVTDGPETVTDKP